MVPCVIYVYCVDLIQLAFCCGWGCVLTIDVADPFPFVLFCFSWYFSEGQGLSTEFEWNQTLEVYL